MGTGVAKEEYAREKLEKEEPLVASNTWRLL
jgi:hypothetical protein